MDTTTSINWWYPSIYPPSPAHYLADKSMDIYQSHLNICILWDSVKSRTTS